MFIYAARHYHNHCDVQGRANEAIGGILTSTNKARARGDSNETCYRSRAETHYRPFAFDAVILGTLVNIMADLHTRSVIERTQNIHVKPPTDAARLVTMQAWIALRLAERAEPPLKPSPRVNEYQKTWGSLKKQRTKPPKPEENSSEDHITSIVRFVCEFNPPIPTSLAEIDGDGQSGGTAADMNRGTTSKVVAPFDKRPPVGVPGPTRDRVIDQGGPDEHEYDDRAEAGTISEATDREHRAKGF